MNHQILVAQDLLDMQAATQKVHVAEELLTYMLDIVAATRNHASIRLGVSPRGGQALYRASKGLALVRGRDFVIPEDIQEMVPMVCAHRLALKASRTAAQKSLLDPAGSLLESLLGDIPAPK